MEIETVLIPQVAKALGRGQPRSVHMSRVKKHTDRKGVLHLLAASDLWHGIVVASDTRRVAPGSRLWEPSRHYNYAARYLVERITRFAETVGDQVRIIFDRRRNFDLEAFQAYMGRLRARAEPRFAWEHFNPCDVRFARPHDTPALCLSDGLAHAAYKALEPHPYWQHQELGYLEAVKPRLWRGPADSRDILRWGFRLMPTAADSLFRAEYPWLNTL